MQRRDKNTMKISIISILLCSLLIGCATSQAGQDSQSIKIAHEPIQPPQLEMPQTERQYGQPFIVTKNVICNDSKVIYNLAKNEPAPQVPVFFGLIKNEHKVAILMTQIFVSIEHNLFTIIESSSDGISCIISAGVEFDILPHYHEGKFQKGSGQEVNKGIWKMPQKIRMQN